MGKLEIWDRHERLEEALSHIHDAINVMRHSEEDDDISDILDDTEMMVRHRRDDVAEEWREMERAEEAALNREYERSVL